MQTPNGFTRDGLTAVRDVFDANLASGADAGASFCATIEGETVVELWGGFADKAKTRHWEKDTIVNVYPTTKTMTALTAFWSPIAASSISARRSRSIGRSSPQTVRSKSKSARS